MVQPHKDRPRGPRDDPNKLFDPQEPMSRIKATSNIASEQNTWGKALMQRGGPTMESLRFIYRPRLSGLLSSS
jgi:hypothetical protein